jgi:hypothetical protein
LDCTSFRWRLRNAGCWPQPMARQQ